jgi:hypothetical protein
VSRVVKLQKNLGGVLGQRSELFAVALGGSDDFHFFPVIRKFVTAIETSHISARQGSGLRTASRSADGYGKAVARVTATEKDVH